MRSGTKHERPSLFPHSSPLTPRRLMSHFIFDARTAIDQFPGIGRYVRNLTAALAPLLSADEQLILLSNPAANATSGALHSGAADGALARTVAASSSPFSIAQQWRIPLLLKRLRSGQPTLYHSPYYVMPYRTGLPTVLTFYDTIPLRYPQSIPIKGRLFYRLATILALRAASRVVTISEAARSDLTRSFRVPLSCVTVTPLAAGSHFRPQSNAEVDRMRNKYGLPTHFILYVGINKPHKNLPALIDAYAQLSAHNAPPLVIAGAWDQRYPQPRQRAQHHQLGDAVRFLGPVNEADLPALYSAATLFVFPSLYEGFGLPVLEAMACGTPVACSNASSLTEVSGEAARLFNPHSVTEIKDAIADLLEDAPQRARRSEQGLAQARRFNWQATAAATLQCYRDLLAVRS